MKQTELTPEQKLEALAMRFYDGFPWQPKKGDYYTTSRADLELYQIVDESDDFFYTVYCDTKKQGKEKPAIWKKEEFLKGFGEKRVFVHSGILGKKQINQRFEDLVFDTARSLVPIGQETTYLTLR